MEQYRAPILYDVFYSLNHGPVVSQTYNLIQGDVRDSGEWDNWISDRDRHEVGLNREANRADLDELSNAEIEVLVSVWDEFGHMDQWELRDWTHHNCPEWKDPHGSSSPFDYDDVFVALGMSRPEAEEIQDQLNRDLRVARVLDRV